MKRVGAPEWSTVADKTGSEMVTDPLLRRFRRDILNARLMGRLRVRGKGLTHL